MDPYSGDRAISLRSIDPNYVPGGSSVYISRARGSDYIRRQFMMRLNDRISKLEAAFKLAWEYYIASLFPLPARDRGIFSQGSW